MVYSYTDMHEVDEDLRTITSYGGQWGDEVAVGITFRGLNDTSTVTVDSVAFAQKINRTYSLF